MDGFGFLTEPGFWIIVAIIVSVFVVPEVWRFFARRASARTHPKDAPQRTHVSKPRGV